MATDRHTAAVRSPSDAYVAPNTEGAVVAETSRQVLRRLVVADAPHFLALDGDPEVTRYTHDGPPESLEAVRAFLAEYQQVYVTDGFARWACCDRTTGAFLGWCGLRKQPNGEIDLGYRYMRSAWGRGLATESAQASLEYAWNVARLERVVATAFKENGASIRILEKLGFRFDQFEEDRGHAIARYVIDAPPSA